MNDKELLELAAKAAGVGYADKNGKFIPFVPDTWNPLEDDGDALRLAVKFGMAVSMCSEYTVILGSMEREEYKDDPYAATRRAIVRAAAEIAKARGEG